MVVVAEWTDAFTSETSGCSNLSRDTKNRKVLRNKQIFISRFPKKRLIWHEDNEILHTQVKQALNAEITELIWFKKNILEMTRILCTFWPSYKWNRKCSPFRSMNRLTFRSSPLYSVDSCYTQYHKEIEFVWELHSQYPSAGIL
jgi:hypothetical protein